MLSVFCGFCVVRCVGWSWLTEYRPLVVRGGARRRLLAPVLADRRARIVDDPGGGVEHHRRAGRRVVLRPVRDVLVVGAADLRERDPRRGETRAHQPSALLSRAADAVAIEV